MTDRPPTDVLRTAAWLRRPRSVIPSLVVLLALIMLVVSMIYIGTGNANGFILLGLALVPLLYHVRRTATRSRLERAAHAASTNCCPHCLYDLSGTPDAACCPECGEAIDLEQLKREWETGLSASEADDPRTWGELTSADMDMPRRLRLCGLTAILGLIVTPVAWFLMDWTTVGAISCGIFVASALAHWVGMSLHGANSWSYLETVRFRICPRCKRDLARNTDSGTCPRCGIGYTPDWLERTWSIIYRRPVAQPGPEALP